MKKTAFLILATLTASASFASDKAVEDLLSKMRDAYRNIGTATFSLEATILGENGDFVAKMDGSFKSPNLVYVSMSAEGEKATVASDGVKIYAVAGDNKKILEVPYDDQTLGQILSGANLEVINLYDWKRQLSTAEGDNMHDSKLAIKKDVSWNGKKWTVLQETAATVGVYVEYYVDPKTNLIWRTVQMSLDKEFTRGDYVLKSLKPGAKVDEGKFKKPVITD